MSVALPTFRMSAALPTFRLSAAAGHDRRLLEAALMAASVAADAIAAGVLLAGTPLTPGLDTLLAAVMHGTAILLVSRVAGACPSRRWLGAAAVLAVPGIGISVALASFLARGRCTQEPRRRRKARRRPALTSAAIRGLGGALSPCDALECGDEDQRRDTLAALSRRADPEAIALLRRATAGPDPDLALSAALALDEIGERAERRAACPDPTEVRHAAG